MDRWARQARRQYASPSGPIKPPQSSAPKPLPYKPRPEPKQQQQGASSSRTGGSSGSAGGNSSSKAQPVSELMRDRWFPLFGVGAATVCIGYFVASLAVHWRKEPPERWAPGCEPQTPTGRPSIQSPVEFDLHLDKSEWRFGITKLRRKLGAAARGHVLEVAMGTGRNLEFYDWGGIMADPNAAEEEEAAAEKKKKKKKSLVEKLEKVRWDRSKLASLEEEEEEEEDTEVRSFTGLDISPGMLDIALRRMRQVVPHLVDALPKRPLFNQLASRKQNGSDCVSLMDNKIRILTADAQSALPPPPPAAVGRAHKYDTIIQTFGLCSVRDPAQLLASMAAALKPETGRILLLEHGRSNWWDLVNGLLDRSARGHFERFGCWWNRDIELIIRDAEQRIPGLEVVKLKRPGLFTLGTHIWIELRLTAQPKKLDGDNSSPEKKTIEEGRPSGDSKVEEQQQQQQSGGWLGTAFGSGSLLTVKKKPSGPQEP